MHFCFFESHWSHSRKKNSGAQDYHIKGGLQRLPTIWLEAEAIPGLGVCLAHTEWAVQAQEDGSAWGGARVERVNFLHSRKVIQFCLNLKSILVWQLPECYLRIMWLKDRVTSPVLLSSLHSSWEEPFTGRKTETKCPQLSGPNQGLKPLRACCLSRCHYQAPTSEVGAKQRDESSRHHLILSLLLCSMLVKSRWNVSALPSWCLAQGLANNGEWPLGLVL